MRNLYSVANQHEALDDVAVLINAYFSHFTFLYFFEGKQMLINLSFGSLASAPNKRNGKLRNIWCWDPRGHNLDAWRKRSARNTSAVIVRRRGQARRQSIISVEFVADCFSRECRLEEPRSYSHGDTFIGTILAEISVCAYPETPSTTREWLREYLVVMQGRVTLSSGSV